jgi:hypothetical protein
MPGHRIFATPFAAVYPMYFEKAKRKGRTKEEVDRVICWLTGYDQAGLQQQIEQKTDFASFSRAWFAGSAWKKSRTR